MAGAAVRAARALGPKVQFLQERRPDGRNRPHMPRMSGPAALSLEFGDDEGFVLPGGRSRGISAFKI